MSGATSSPRGGDARRAAAWSTEASQQPAAPAGARCPICRTLCASAEAYRDHLSTTHGLDDDEGTDTVTQLGPAPVLDLTDDVGPTGDRSQIDSLVWLAWSVERAGAEVARLRRSVEAAGPDEAELVAGLISRAQRRADQTVAAVAGLPSEDEAGPESDDDRVRASLVKRIRQVSEGACRDAAALARDHRAGGGGETGPADLRARASRWRVVPDSGSPPPHRLGGGEPPG